MHVELDVQYASALKNLPEPPQLHQWCCLALAEFADDCELTIRIVDLEEAQALNLRWRNKDYPTNVLSFPSELPKLPTGVHLEFSLLGDLVVCAPVVAQEATEQAVDPTTHWAHLVIHGCLHLLGYDHIDESAALVMEALETKLLSQLGYADPYNNSHTLT